MKIPEKLIIGAVEWDVVFDEKETARDDAYGVCNYDASKISICQQSRGDNRKESAIEHTFVHETIHACLDAIGYRELSRDETFVNSFATVMHQVIKQIK